MPAPAPDSDPPGPQAHTLTVCLIRGQSSLPSGRWALCYIAPLRRRPSSEHARRSRPGRRRRAGGRPRPVGRQQQTTRPRAAGGSPGGRVLVAPQGGEAQLACPGSSPARRPSPTPPSPWIVVGQGAEQQATQLLAFLGAERGEHLLVEAHGLLVPPPEGPAAGGGELQHVAAPVPLVALAGDEPPHAPGNRQR
jgi:hypothetical protein